jgi:hypothetical protein
MAEKGLSGRTVEYIDTAITTVDITQCKPGAHARAIKPGGIEAIKSSIKESGYKRVLLFLFPLLYSMVLTSILLR